MQKFLCSIALGAFLALTANAVLAQSADAAPPPPPQGGRWQRGPMDPAAQAAHMAKRLNLSAEQETQVQALFTNQQAQRKALEQNQSMTHQQFMAQSKTLREQTDTKIESLLNDDQKKQFAEMKSHMRGGPPPTEGGEAPPPPPQ